jgi:hypothetical protein
MRIAGVYVGLGEGDISPEVGKVKALLKRKFTPARNTLDDGDLFTPALTAEVKRVQEVYTREGRAGAAHYAPGVINLEFKYDVGLLPRPEKPKPIIFTVEGHMSNMFVGPCAFVASTLEQQGLCHWKPIGYNNTALPFDNSSGVNALVDQLNRGAIEGPNGPDGRPIMWPFPDDLNWGLLGFSQGAIVTNKTWLHHLRDAAPGSRLAARRDHLKRAVAFGDPYREKDVIAEWVPDPPRPGTQGISDERMTNTPAFWKVHSRHGDLYSENGTDEVGLNKTAVYRIVSESSWVGGPAGMLARVLDLMQDPVDGVIDIARAIISGAMFLPNMGPHGQYDLNPCIDWMRGVA